MPGTWARGEKHPAEDLGGLLELGKAEEKDEGPEKRVKNIPPLGKSRQFWEMAKEGAAREDGRWKHMWRQEVEICRRSQDEGGVALHRSTWSL